MGGLTSSLTYKTLPRRVVIERVKMLALWLNSFTISEGIKNNIRPWQLFTVMPLDDKKTAGWNLGHTVIYTSKTFPPTPWCRAQNEEYALA